MKLIPVFLITVLSSLPLCVFAYQSEKTDLVETGRRIYVEGILSDGALLTGVRDKTLTVQGRDAACVLCHRRSGMGLAEGASLVPPISAPALFGKLQLASYGGAPMRAPGMTFTDWPFKTRPVYDDASLATAIRSGISPTGYQFQYIMPRYDLAESDMKALIAYLHTLSVKPSPGVSAKEAHFATVITPETTDEQRASFLAVLKSCMAEKFPETHETAQAWRLHVWELDGHASTWQDQLNAHYARQPVFAMVSGLGMNAWHPVEDFCETSRIPCLFPNTDLPGKTQDRQYSFYFFRGALLEADVMASYLNTYAQNNTLKRLVVVTRSDDAGMRAADNLSDYLLGDYAIEQRILHGISEKEIASAFDDIQPQDALIILLREDDLAAVANYLAVPPKAGVILLSGLLGGLEDTPLPTTWREKILMTYPYDPPVRWNRRMDFNLRPWLAAQKIARDDERMQGNTLAACNLLYESMLRLRGQYLREYLVEAIENYPAFMGNAPAAQAFPRFSIGPGQRFSSKGAYVVRFTGEDAKDLKPDADWIIP